MRIEGKVKESFMHTVWIEVDDTATQEEIDELLMAVTMKYSTHSSLEVFMWKEMDIHE